MKHCIARWAGRALVLLSLLAGPAWASDPAVLLDQIRALPGVASAIQAPSPIPGTYFFRIGFVQPVDHRQPDGASFVQRVTLLHRDESGPMVLVTDGYSTPASATQQELTYYLQANQLRVEHRFFAASVPAPLDWRLLDIGQAAADHHAIVQAFKTLYPAGWVATGASKSGMASVYFRFLYPDDVDATVPYVAPSSHGTYDARYVQFLSRVGPADCRQQLREFQTLALQRREAIEALSPTPASEFTALGKDRAFEFAVVELPFAFWQYQNQALCPQIPGAGASDQDLLDFIDLVVGLDFYSDPVLDFYAPYFYQSATQLGGPRIDERAFDGLLRYPRQDIPANYPPLDAAKRFDAAAMPQVERWVRDRGERMIFIYGENDPWSTGAFEVRAGNDAYRYFVKGDGGNHGANLTRLDAAERDFALARLRQWLGLPTFALAAAPAADEYGFDPPSREELFLK